MSHTNSEELHSQKHQLAEESTTELEKHIENTTGVTQSPEQKATNLGYILEEATIAKDDDGNVTTLPAGTRVRL